MIGTKKHFIIAVIVWLFIIGFVVSCSVTRNFKEKQKEDCPPQQERIKYINVCDTASVEARQLLADYEFVTGQCVNFSKDLVSWKKRYTDLENDYKSLVIDYDKLKDKKNRIVIKRIKIRDSNNNNQTNSQITELNQINDSLESVINNFSPQQSPVMNAKCPKTWLTEFIVACGVLLVICFVYVKKKFF